MKVIISHDIDHITALEHKKDLIIPKFIVRNFIEFGLGYASIHELTNRLRSIIKNRWQNIEELMEFDKENKIPSTFFIAVSNGRNLSYTLNDAKIWVNKIIQKGFDIGIHGVVFDEYAGIKREYKLFKKISKLDRFGIRIHDIGKRPHDIKLTLENLNLLNKAQYIFSSNFFQSGNPFKVGNLWEFPIHIMDGDIFGKNRRWQNQTLEQAKQETEKSIQNSYANEIRYFNILFHDGYFSESFKVYREWYYWFIDYCKKSGFQLVNYRKAINELETEMESRNRTFSEFSI